MINYNQKDEEELNRMFIQLSKEYGLNPAFLRQIIPLRNSGYNNTQIAERTGISRVTINTYVDKIRQHETEEGFKKLLLLGVGLYVGYKILEDIFRE